MILTPLLLAIAASTSAAGADVALQPQPLAPSAKIAAIKAGARSHSTALPSPTITETKAVRMPDGTIALVCDQQRNPRSPVVIRTPAPEPQQ